MQPFLIPDDFRAFMQQVVAYLDGPSEDKFLDAEDALQDETGYGGRFDGADLYRFVYITADGLYKWELAVREAAVREIADGLLIEVSGERFDIVRTHHRESVGMPLLIWGEYGDDALHARDDAELLRALDGLHAAARLQPRMLRMWTAADDQVIACLWREDCALYVVESADGYSTSCGEPGRASEGFEVVDDGRPMQVPPGDCVPWERARNALLRFAERGELGPEIRVDGRIPSQLLMMGDVDRKAALAARGDAPRQVASSSLPRLAIAPVGESDSPVPVAAPPDDRTSRHPIAIPLEPPLRVEDQAAWARRLIELLEARALIELGDGNLDEITYQLGGLLQAHGHEAQHSLETAEWLANEIGAVRGIARLFATAGDLQIALRRSRD